MLHWAVSWTAHDVSEDRVALIPTTQRHISDDLRITESRIWNLTIYFKIVYPYTDENRLAKSKHYTRIIAMTFPQYSEGNKIWCWRRMEIIWTDRVRNEEGLKWVKEDRNILHTTNNRKANWIGHILRRNCLLKHVIGGKIEGKR